MIYDLYIISSWFKWNWKIAHEYSFNTKGNPKRFKCLIVNEISIHYEFFIMVFSSYCAFNRVVVIDKEINSYIFKFSSLGLILKR